MSSRCPVVRYDAKRVVRDDGKSLRFDVAPLLDARKGSMYLVFRLCSWSWLYFLCDDVEIIIYVIMILLSFWRDDGLFSSVKLLFG